MTGKIKSPKIYDPYLGEMYGNILDKYDNPAYNLRLYLKPETISSPGDTSSPATSNDPGNQAAPGAGGDPRSDTPTATATPTQPVDRKVVIVAQTGVTANQIDNLSIDGVPDEEGQINVEFTVVQPGAANLLDQIQYGRKYIGVSDDEMTAKDFTMYLDVSFVGYTLDTVDDIGQPDDNEAGGDPTQIIDTVTYPLMIRKVSVQVTNTGSQYTFSGIIMQSLGRNDETFKLPMNITIRGSTITEFFADLEEKYNTALREQSTEYKPDRVKFDVSALLGTIEAPGEQGITTTGAARQRLYIRDEKIPTQGDDQRVEGTTAPRFDNTLGQTAADVRRDADGASNAGSTETAPDKVLLNLSQGDSIEKIVATILSMNREFQQLATRVADINDPGNREVNDERSFINWFDIYSQVENLGWDKQRGKYTRKYTYTPYLTQDIRSDILLTTSELDYLKEKGEAFGRERPVAAIATKRLQDLYNQGAISKSYFYIFTGLNDQIINLDITLDNAITILVPPKGGMIGDFSVTSSPALTNSEPENRDLTLDPELQKAKDTQNKELISTFLQDLRDLTSQGRRYTRSAGELIANLAQTVGRSPEDVAAILKDTTSKSADAFAESLASAEAERLLQSLGASEDGDPSDVPTTNTEISVTNSGRYAPEVSGFLYTEDIVQPGRFTTDEIEAAGLNVLDSNIPTDAGPATPQTKSVDTPLSGMTSTGPSSVLMGYVYRSRQQDGQFLVNIDLTVRGDPYWLTDLASGKFEYGNPSPDQTVHPSATTYYFLLTIGTPTQYDYNISDEDENSGYWSDGRTSGYFSGLYMPIKWKNVFSNGVFTTEIKAVKEIAVPLQWIKRVAPGETPPAWDEYFTEEDYNDFINQSALQREANRPQGPGTGGSGSNDPSSPPIPLEDLPALQLGGEKSQQAKAQAEAFLGRPITPREWELLVRATVGESGGGGAGAEDANIAAVILNRARLNSGGHGTGIEDQLRARNAFQAVTGTRANGRQPNQGFANPSQQQIARVTNNILSQLSGANNTWLNFTAYDVRAYGPGTNIEFRNRALRTPGHRVVGNRGERGGTIFFTDRPGG